MKRLTITAFFTLLILILPVRADFNSGLQAYQNGDFATALKEWTPLAERGDANAQYNLGLMYAKGQGVTKDYAAAAKWYSKAAEQGNINAQYNLGLMYSNGEGVPKNESEAMKWYLKAANQGDTSAANNLGTIYDEGNGAFKDYAEALKWYRKAAEDGIATAQFNLGVMYDIGQGVTKDYAEALKWYRKAAEQGNSGALTNLGILYYNGQGVTRDLVEAYAWFSRGAKAGDRIAGELMRSTAEKLKPPQLAKAERLAADWHPAKAPAASRTGTEVASAKAPAVETERSRADLKPVSNTQTPAAPLAKLPTTPTKTQDVWTGVERVIAVGDVHGDYEQFVAVLQSAKLIDEKLHWIGGKTHLVQTGDILDRGPDSRKVMDLLMYLEQEASKSGGYVHCLIGNHEAMNVYGDLRYVSPGEIAAFRSEKSEDVRTAAYEKFRGDLAKMPAPAGLAAPDEDRAHWEAQHPAGFTEHRAQLGPNGPYGKWISSHNTIIKIDDTLFVHAGLSEKYSGYSMDEINQRVRDELKDPEKLHGGIAIDPEGPLWFKGMAKGDEKELQPLVSKILQKFAVKRIVIGHTYANAAITPRFDGKVIMIDIGLSRVYDNIGKLGCLLIENNQPYALHRGTKIGLPSSSGEKEMLRYLKEAAALDPSPSPLADRISALEGKQ